MLPSHNGFASNTRCELQAVRERRCKDNCTVLLAVFNHKDAVMPD